MNTEGCKNLIAAVYRQAAIDYIKAVLRNKKESRKEIENFLMDHERGRYIQKKCLEEIEICRRLIDKFLESDLEKIQIDKKLISVPVLLLVKNVRYTEEISIEFLHKDSFREQIYLHKKMKPLADRKTPLRMA